MNIRADTLPPINRRSFIRSAAFAAAGAGLSGISLAEETSTNRAPAASAPRNLRYKIAV